MQAHTSWQLAKLADCIDPDAHDGRGFEHYDGPTVEGSPGAQFLRAVEDATFEAIEDSYADEDSAHEIADGAVPVYTHSLWQTFVDLGAYQEDASELGADASDLEQCARVALYMIAERLARALIEAQEDEDEDEETAPDVAAQA